MSKGERVMPYGDSAKRYLKLGFWPIPVTGKAYPEPGTTGKDGVVTAELVKHLRSARASRNVAIRHVDTMALDIDGLDHDGKNGERTLAQRVKKWGPLPPTWSSTARGDKSATRQVFYRIPEGTKLVSDLQEWVKDTNPDGSKVDGGIEVIHHDHRYSVVAPSVHPDTGKAYRWYDPSGQRSDYPPHIDELPDLPEKWLEKLTAKTYDAPKKAKPGKTVAKVDEVELSADDRERIARWLGTALDGITADLDELSAKATARLEDYKGQPWDETVFKKAVRLAELAGAWWSPLTLDEAEALLFKHAPRDAGFTDKHIAEKWASATRTAAVTELELPVIPSTDLYTIPLPEREVRAARVSPDSFFDNKTGLLAERLADAVSYDLALGPDGSVWVYEAGVWQRRDDEVERRVARTLGNRFRREHAANARVMITKGHDLPVIEREPDPRLINTRSGMIDWRTGKLEPHDPELLSTVQLPIEYDATAVCPTFDAWLEAVVDEDTIALVWETIGYLFMSGNPLHKAVLLVGKGRNGKGTLLRLITHLVGKRNTSSLALTDITDGKFEVAGLFGKLINIAGDIEARSLTNTAKFKAITGGDSILAQHKGGHPFEFTPWAVPVFSANQLWQSADNTDGYLDRWLVLPFPRKLEKRGLFDESTLRLEASGILNKALAGLRELMARGEFELSGHAADMQRQFELESDVVKVWLKEDERIVASEAGNTTLRVGRTDVYRRYSSWAADSGHGALNSSNFYRRIENLGFDTVKVKGQRQILGIALDVASHVPLKFPHEVDHDD
jgi:putative DNA primase/helicase